MSSNVRKWLIWAGAFLVLVGFFLPSPTIYFAPFKLDFSKEGLVSVNYIARTGQAILYLALIGALVSAIFSLFSSRNRIVKIVLALGEGVGMALGVTSFLLAAIFAFELFGDMNPQIFGIEVLSSKFQVTLVLFILLLGYSLEGFGVLLDVFEAITYRTEIEQNSMPDYDATAEPTATPNAGASSPSLQELVSPAERMPRLELMSGNAPRVVEISNGDFHLGRSSQNDCPIKDPQVSRVHARIRGAKGAWFIQDQNSSGGTFVNGARVQAQRLNDGDEIRMGLTVFKFYL